MKVIGFAGTNGAGKDTVADYVCERYGYKKITVGDIIRQRLKEEGIGEIDRKVTGEYQKKYVEKYGIDYWMKEVIAEIKNQGWKKAAISGLRYPNDVDAPREEFGEDFFAILVDADPKVRFERMTSRARYDAPKNIEEFNKQEEYENRMFSFEETKKKIDFVIDNGGTLEETHAQIDRLLKEKGFD